MLGVHSVSRALAPKSPEDHATALLQISTMFWLLLNFTAKKLHSDKCRIYDDRVGYHATNASLVSRLRLQPRSTLSLSFPELPLWDFGSPGSCDHRLGPECCGNHHQSPLLPWHRGIPYFGHESICRFECQRSGPAFQNCGFVKSTTTVLS